MFYGAQLVEPGAMYYYNKTLQSCHNLKETYYNIYYNIRLGLGLGLGLNPPSHTWIYSLIWRITLHTI